MATIRQQIITEVVERLQAAQTEWSVQRRKVAGNPANEAAVTAVVAFVNEDKAIANSDAYLATLQLLVALTVNVEDADTDPDVDDGDAYLYLDRMVAEVEKAMHTPDEWGPNPLFADIVVLGHDVPDPEGETTVLTANVRLQFRYRHHYQDPSA